MLFDKPDVKVRKFGDHNKDECIRKASQLKKLVGEKASGWLDFVKILDEYCDKAMKRKALTALDRATDQEIYEWKLLDHEIWFIKNFILEIPMRYVKGLEKSLAEDKKKEENKGVSDGI